MNDPPTVTELVSAAAQGDERAWKALVDRYTPLVASVTIGFRLPGHDAEDVVQTVWLRLIEHLGDLRDPRALPMWIITTTRNECVRLLKLSQRTRPFDPTVERAELRPADTADLDEALLKAELHQALLAAFAELPRHQRDLLLLLVADPPVSYAEISTRLRIPVGSIGPTRARALRRLRECAELVHRPDAHHGVPGGGDGHDFATLGRR